MPTYQCKIWYIILFLQDEKTLPDDVLRPDFEEQDVNDDDFFSVVKLSRKQSWISCFPQLETPPDK